MSDFTLPEKLIVAAKCGDSIAAEALDYIESLQARLDSLIDESNESNELLLERCDELQARIDDYEKWEAIEWQETTRLKARVAELEEFVKWCRDSEHVPFFISSKAARYIVKPDSEVK